MATSSIFANFNIADSKKAEAFVNALEISAQECTEEKKTDTKSFVVLPADIKSLWEKRKEQK